jgi:DNA polymerase III subunit delta
MAAEQRKRLPRFVVCMGGDAFLNDREVRDCRDRALQDDPTAEAMELDATETDQYDFDEAVSPSLLSSDSVVVIRHVQNADEPLAEAMVNYCQSVADGA